MSGVSIKEYDPQIQIYGKGGPQQVRNFQDCRVRIDRPEGRYHFHDYIPEQKENQKGQQIII